MTGCTATDAVPARDTLRPEMKRELFLLAAVSLALPAACGGDDDTTASTTAASPSTTVATTTAPTDPMGSDDGAFPEGEPVDLVYIADSSSVGEPYADLVAEILDREVRLDMEVEEDPDAIRTTYADRIAEAEIIVFYFNSIAFDEDMPGPTFDESCLEGVFALENPDDSDAEWTPGTKWQPVPAARTADDWRPYRDWLSEVWESIWEVREGQPVVLRAYDVYNPWLGQWVELGIEPECSAVWEGQAQAAREAAEANGATFVSFYDLFNGPGHDEDARAKGWIADDGMHASDAGATAAAEALAAVGFELNEPPG